MFQQHQGHPLRRVIDDRFKNHSQKHGTEKLMMRFVPDKIAIVLLMGSIGLSADEDQSLKKPKLSAENAKVRDLVLPNQSEASYRKIPWRTSVLQGIVDAQKNDKPVMIYLMNGHPLGCT